MSTNDWVKRLEKMTPLQRYILAKIWNKIKSCEGMIMPRKYWCDSCTSSWARFHELFTRFELMNAHRKMRPYKWDTLGHPGFDTYDK